MPAPKPYWSMRDTVVAAQAKRVTDEREAVAELQRLLSIAIKRQCLSDVPLGAFLSGGIDSSTIVALMQAQASQPVRTFTIGFREDVFDEAKEARQVAAHLGTSHTELYVDPETARNVIPKLPTMYDEPFGDSSQIPTHLVSALARQHVTVALSGDAGDEMFGGYNRHVWGDSLNARFGAMPAALRQMLGVFLRAVSPEPAGTIVRLASPLLPARFNVRRAGDQVAKLARIVGSPSLDHMYRELCSIDNDPTQTIVDGEEAESWSAAEMDKVKVALRSARSDDACGLLELSDRRHPAKGRSGRDGGCAGNPRAVSRQGCRGICRQNSARHESSRWSRQMAGQAGALSARSGQIWSIGRKPALVFRSTTGCAGR